MQQKISLRLSPQQAADDLSIKSCIVDHSGRKLQDISGYHILKRSIDARGKQVLINLTLLVFFNEPLLQRTIGDFQFKDVSRAPKSVIIIGAGPAGLFAALKLLEAGIRPVILERGKDVRSRRRDLAMLNKEGRINTESNYCFGEGGAGTYSDGKLYTRSNKRGDIERILHLFVHFGAQPDILSDAHPHIGTNKLPGIISEMRKLICEQGGKVVFEKKVIDLHIENGKITAVATVDGDIFSADAFILATGHSARDIFELLLQKKLQIEAKPFALGVRAEHPQSLINNIQYHCSPGSDLLPPASYSLVQQVNDNAVFSFCMCPGGIIAPASTNENEVVVNGWSPSRRNNPYANSGIVVPVTAEEAFKATKHLNIRADDPLLFMYFQQLVEERSFRAGGGKFVAPAQRIVDFSNRKLSENLPPNSYVRGVQSAALNEVLPGFIYNALAMGFIAFGKKMKGYFTNDAIVVATESRTSSPVRIPRDPSTFLHPQVDNLYPCGEGAGYAGGIVSAAMDGENIAAAISTRFWSS